VIGFSNSFFSRNEWAGSWDRKSATEVAAGGLKPAAHLPQRIRI
jgi:hypothetical protein